MTVGELIELLQQPNIHPESEVYVLDEMESYVTNIKISIDSQFGYVCLEGIS